MIKTIKSLLEEVDKFNSYNKYIETCDYCHNQTIYTNNELDGNIFKCPYCGHTQKILYKKEYNVILKLSIVNSFDDDSYKV